MEIVEINVGDVVRLKKKHPCGNELWQVVRVGADIGIRCRKCHRHVLLSRSVFERRVREVLSEVGGADEQDTSGENYGSS